MTIHSTIRMLYKWYLLQINFQFFWKYTPCSMHMCATIIAYPFKARTKPFQHYQWTMHQGKKYSFATSRTEHRNTWTYAAAVCFVSTQPPAHVAFVWLWFRVAGFMLQLQISALAEVQILFSRTRIWFQLINAHD